MSALRLALAASLAVLAGACAHTPAVGSGATCDSFVEQDAATRRQLDELLGTAPGDQLVTEASRLNRERRACARHVLATLPTRREERGIEALQRELDALVATYRPDDLDAMLADALGDDALPLRPYLAEARTRLERERRAGAAERRDTNAAHRPATDATALGTFEAQRGSADREAPALLAAHEAERRRADGDATRALGSLDGARRDADRDAARSLGALDGAQRDADRWASGSAASELPPLRPADDVTAEALRSLDGARDGAGPCSATRACVRLTCDALGERDADALARRCLDDVSAHPHEERARQVAAVLTRLRDFAPLPALTEALSTLETLRRQDWPGIEAAAQQGQRGLAAQRASPFLALDRARAEVQRLRDEGQAHHLQRARALAATPAAAWVHAKVAEQLGGPAAPPFPEKGRWAPARWRCSSPAPERLPALPPGVEATLHATCSQPSRSTDRSELRTFDMDLGGQRVEGFLVVACADKSNSFSFRVEEPGVSGFPAAALDAELGKLVGVATKTCREQRDLAALKDCAELKGRSPADTLRRYALHAKATGAWATCFREWLETTEGVAPPRLE